MRRYLSLFSPGVVKALGKDVMADSSGNFAGALAKNMQTAAARRCATPTEFPFDRGEKRAHAKVAKAGIDRMGNTTAMTSHHFLSIR
jgi:hypothetical protein